MSFENDYSSLYSKSNNLVNYIKDLNAQNEKNLQADAKINARDYLYKEFQEVNKYASKCLSDRVGLETSRNRTYFLERINKVYDEVKKCKHSFLSDDIEAEIKVLESFKKMAEQPNIKEAYADTALAASPAAPAAPQIPTHKPFSITESMIYKNMDRMEAQRHLKEKNGSFLVRVAKAGDEYLDYRQSDLKNTDTKNILVVSYFNKIANRFEHTTLVLEKSEKGKSGQYRMLGTNEHYPTVGDFVTAISKAGYVDIKNPLPHHVQVINELEPVGFVFPTGYSEEIVKSLNLPGCFMVRKLGTDDFRSGFYRPQASIYQGSLDCFPALKDYRPIELGSFLRHPPQDVVWVDQSGKQRHTVLFPLEGGKVLAVEENGGFDEYNSLDHFLDKHTELNYENMITPEVLAAHNEMNKLIAEKNKYKKELGLNVDQMEKPKFKNFKEYQASIKPLKEEVQKLQEEIVIRLTQKYHDLCPRLEVMPETLPPGITIEEQYKVLSKKVEHLEKEEKAKIKTLISEHTALIIKYNALASVLIGVEEIPMPYIWKSQTIPALRAEIESLKKKIVPLEESECRSMISHLLEDQAKLLTMLGKQVSHEEDSKDLKSQASGSTSTLDQLKKQRKELRENIATLRQEVWELQEDLAASWKPRPFLTPEINDLQNVSLSAAHYNTGVSNTEIPEAPAGIDIRKLNAFLQLPNVKNKIPAQFQRHTETGATQIISKDRFITDFTLRINSLAEGRTIKDNYGKEFPQKYRNTCKKILGWITSRFIEREDAIAKLEKEAEAADPKTKAELEQKAKQLRQELETDIVKFIAQDIGESFLNCFGRSAQELIDIYYQMGFVSPEEAKKAYEADTLPVRVQNVIAKYRLAVFNEMFKINRHHNDPLYFRPGLQPEYTLYYHNKLAAKYGLGSTEISSVETEYTPFVQKGLEGEFEKEFLRLYNSKSLQQWLVDKLNDPNDTEIPKKRITDWFEENYNYSVDNELVGDATLLPDGTWSPGAIAMMMRDMGVTEWPQLNPTASQRLAKVNSYSEQVAKCSNINQLCHIAYRVLNESKRLTAKQLQTKDEADEKRGIEFDKQHAELLGAIEMRSIELLSSLDKKLAGLQATSQSINQDLEILNEAIKELSFIYDDRFSERNLQPSKDGKDDYKNLREFIIPLRARIKGLEEKRFLLNLKVISKQLETKDPVKLEQLVKLAEKLVQKLESTDKIADLTDAERKGFVSTIREALGNAKIRLEDLQKEKEEAEKVKEKDIAVDALSRFNKRYTDWDDKIKNGFSTQAEWEKFGQELNMTGWQLARNAGPEAARRLHTLSEAYKQARPK